MKKFMFFFVIGLLITSCKTAGRSQIKKVSSVGENGFSVIGCKEDQSRKWAEHSKVVCGLPLTFCFIGSRDNVIRLIESKPVVVQDDYQLKHPKKGEGKLLEFQLVDSNGYKDKGLKMSPCVGKTRSAVLASLKKADSGEEPIDEEPTEYSGVKCKDTDSGKYNPIEDISCDGPFDNGGLCFSGDIQDVVATINKGGVVFGDDMELRKAKIDPKNAKAVLAIIWDMPNEVESERVSIKSCSR